MVLILPDELYNIYSGDIWLGSDDFDRTKYDFTIMGKKFKCIKRPPLKMSAFDLLIYISPFICVNMCRAENVLSQAAKTGAKYTCIAATESTRSFKFSEHPLSESKLPVGQWRLGSCNEFSDLPHDGGYVHYSYDGTARQSAKWLNHVDHTNRYEWHSRHQDGSAMAWRLHGGSYTAEFSDCDRYQSDLSHLSFFLVYQHHQYS